MALEQERLEQEEEERAREEEELLREQERRNKKKTKEPTPEEDEEDEKQQSSEDDDDDDQFLEDAPKYYQPGIVPQAVLKPSQKDAYDAFISKLFNPYLPLDEQRDLFMKPLPALIG